MTGARPAPDYDLILVGGGLANSLIAWRLLTRQPQLNVLIIERGATLGGNHTWSFHGGDVAPGTLADLHPFLAASWPRQCVRFPGHSRVLDVPYHAIASHRLHEVLSAQLGHRMRLDTAVASFDATTVTLAGQRVLTAACVIDGRGPGQDDPPLALGFQKFLGLEVETSAPHGETIPVIMDATVAQIDGYRFVYTLPLSPTRILIEDTYYSDGPELDAATLSARVRAYAVAKGWRITSVVREERGVLPVVLAGDMDAFWRWGDPDVPRVGLRGALFHPTTGYSLPDAIAFADLLAASGNFTSPGVRRLVEARARALWAERGFFRLLNRLLFIAATPAQRVSVLERFYRLPGPLIERFFAGRLTTMDKAMIMMGKPPVALHRAIGAIGTQPAWTFARRTTPQSNP